MLSFRPYRTMSYYVTNRTIFTCSVLETRDFFKERMGFSGCAELPHHNSREYLYGQPRPDQEARIRRAFAKDQALWDKHCASGCERCNWPPPVHKSGGTPTVIVAVAVVIVVLGILVFRKALYWIRRLPFGKLRQEEVLVAHKVCRCS